MKIQLRRVENTTFAGLTIYKTLRKIDFRSCLSFRPCTVKCESRVTLSSSSSSSELSSLPPASPKRWLGYFDAGTEPLSSILSRTGGKSRFRKRLGLFCMVWLWRKLPDHFAVWQQIFYSREKSFPKDLPSKHWSECGERFRKFPNISLLPSIAGRVWKVSRSRHNTFHRFPFLRLGMNVWPHMKPQCFKTSFC